MQLGEHELSFLNTLQEFSKVKRYNGVMPEWLTCSCVRCNLDGLVEAGFVENGQGEYEDCQWYTTKLCGVRLTDKGRKYLRSVS